MNQEQKFSSDKQYLIQQNNYNFNQTSNGQYQQQNYLNYAQSNQFFRQQLQQQPSIIYYTYPILYNPIQFCTSSVYGNQQIGYYQYNICKNAQLNQQEGLQNMDNQNGMNTSIQQQYDSRCDILCESIQNEQKSMGLKINCEEDEQIIQRKQIFQIAQRQGEISSQEDDFAQKTKNEDQKNKDVYDIDISKSQAKKDKNSFQLIINQNANNNNLSTSDMYEGKDCFVNQVIDDKNQNFKVDVIKDENIASQSNKRKKSNFKQQVINDYEQNFINCHLKQDIVQDNYDVTKEVQQSIINNGQINQKNTMKNNQQINSSQKQVSAHKKFAKNEKFELENYKILNAESTFVVQTEDLDQEILKQTKIENVKNSQLNESQQKQAYPNIQQSVQIHDKETKKFNPSYQGDYLERTGKNKIQNSFYKQKPQNTSITKEEYEYQNQDLTKNDLLKQETNSNSYDEDYCNHNQIYTKCDQTQQIQYRKNFKYISEKKDATQEIASKQLDNKLLDLNDQKEKLINQLSDEERDIVKQALQINRQNANKNIIKTFQKYINETLAYTFEYQKKNSNSYYFKVCKDEEVIKNENPTDQEKIQFKKKFNKFISSKSYTNMHIKQIISNRIYGQILFNEFLQNNSKEWLEKANVNDKNQYTIILNFYKICCANTQLLIFLNDVHVITKSSRLSKFQKNSQKYLQKSCESQTYDS
ncbi:hypothetical protein ABPG74_001426 [Tetrahymena malaccensis]